MSIVNYIRTYILGYFISVIVGLFLYFLIKNTTVFDGSNYTVSQLGSHPFSRYTLKSADSTYRPLHDYTGNYTLINFWFIGCAPCLESMKLFPELLKTYKQLQIVSVNVDSYEAMEASLQGKIAAWSFLRKQGPNWAFLNVDSTNRGLLSDFQVTSFPSYFVLNPEGKVISHPKNGIYEIESMLNSLLVTPLAWRQTLSDLDYVKLIRATLLGYSLLYSLCFVGLFVKKRLTARPNV